MKKSHAAHESHQRFATNRESLEYLKLVVRRLYDAQKLRIQSDLRVQRLEREGIVIKEHIESTFAKAQELEVATEKEYERIVARELKKFPIWSEWLAQVKGIGPRIAGLLIANIATPERFDNVAKLWAYCGLHTQPSCVDCGHVVSHCRNEPHSSNASQSMNEPPSSLASHGTLEPQELNASHNSDEAHSSDASQGFVETHKKAASQSPPESHREGAIQNHRETQPLSACPKCGSKNIRNVAARRRVGQKANWSSELKTTLWKAAASFVKQKDGYRIAYEQYKEYLIARQMKRNEIIWKRDPKGTKYIAAFLPEMFHDGNTPKPPDKPDWTLGRIDNMSKRWTAKLFLSHLWAAWRELEGLPVTKPYAFTNLGHKDYVTPWEMVDPAKVDDVSRKLRQVA